MIKNKISSLLHFVMILADKIEKIWLWVMGHIQRQFLTSMFLKQISKTFYQV